MVLLQVLLQPHRDMSKRTCVERSNGEKRHERVPKHSHLASVVELPAIVPLDRITNLLPKSDLALCCGGAAGADALFTCNAIALGVPSFTFSFSGHHIHNSVTELKSAHNKIVLLTDAQLEQAHADIAAVCRTLQRPPLERLRPYVRRLLLRDYWQVVFARCVYVVSMRDRTAPSLGIAGGSAYACEVFAARHSTAIGPMPLYLFDQRNEERCWWQAVRAEAGVLSWQRVASGELPPPHGCIAAIGTRDLNDAGRQAIESLFAAMQPVGPSDAAAEASCLD